MNKSESLKNASYWIVWNFYCFNFYWLFLSDERFKIVEIFRKTIYLVFLDEIILFGRLVRKLLSDILS